MRIVVWNCCMALRAQKVDYLSSLAADIAVVPECSRADAEAMAEERELSHVWSDGGETDRAQKGLAVFARAGLDVSLRADHDPSFRVVLPVEVRGAERLNLLAVWAKPPYAPTVYRALERYAAFLQAEAGVVLGDFNSNSRWDGGRTVNHTAVDRKLGELAMASAYHAFFGEEQGLESRATHYFLRKVDRPFHVDYCYIPVAWLPRLTDVSVGDHKSWLGHSDHAPLAVTVTPEG
jgi:exodeoxyribonuclease-3